MASSSRLSRSIVLSALLAALAGAWAPGARGATCPVPAPVLTGPSGIQAGESYALSWTSVFTDLTASSVNYNYYVVERALDSAFSSSLNQITTQRSAITLPPAPASAKVLYHRIVVKSSCPTASVAAIVSNVVSVPVKSDCDVPPSVGELGANPPNPPAFVIIVRSPARPAAGVKAPGKYQPFICSSNSMPTPSGNCTLRNGLSSVLVGSSFSPIRVSV